MLMFVLEISIMPFTAVIYLVSIILFYYFPLYLYCSSVLAADNSQSF